MADSFDSTLFNQSFQKVFEKDGTGVLKMAFNATLEVYLKVNFYFWFLSIQIKLGNGLKVEGVLGSCSSANAKNSMVSDTEVGIGGTIQWKMCSLTPRSTFGFIFEISGQVYFCNYVHFSRMMFIFPARYRNPSRRTCYDAIHYSIPTCWWTAPYSRNNNLSFLGRYGSK